MSRTIALILAAVMLSILAAPMSAYAVTPYSGYVYDHKDNPVPSLNGYVYMDSIDGYDGESGPFKAPQHLFIAADDSLYIVDSGNNRVVHLSSDNRLLRVFGTAEGDGRLNNPKGVFVTDDGTVYVADTKNSRIAVFDSSGKFVRDYRDPKNPLLGDKFQFVPSKLVVDKRGYMFVVVDGLYQGLMQLDPNGEFAGFFGANHIPFSVTRIVTRLIATKEQKAQMATEKPPEFSNLFQDRDGFIYTTTLGIDTMQAKRLSAVGVDTLNAQESAKGRYGDTRFRVVTDSKGKQQERKHVFVSVTVDNQGFITVLDQMTGKAFQYDSLGNLLFVFGGIGSQDGLMITPSSIAVTSKGVIYIADETRNRIDRFRTTEFGELVHKASILYSDGQYEQSKEPWIDVLERNSNYNLAYLAIGKALYKQEQYKEAMEYFKTARAYKEYSLAYLEHRKNYMREHFVWFVLGAILFAVIFRIFLGWRRRQKMIMNKKFYSVRRTEGGAQ